MADKRVDVNDTGMAALNIKIGASLYGYSLSDRIRTDSVETFT